MNWTFFEAPRAKRMDPDVSGWELYEIPPLTVRNVMKVNNNLNPMCSRVEVCLCLLPLAHSFHGLWKSTVVVVVIIIGACSDA